MSEQVFFENDGIKVTSSRFVSAGQTYAMSNVTSIKTIEKSPPRSAPVVLIVVGLALLATHWMVAAPALVGGIVWIVRQKTMHHIMLHTSGGEASALSTTDKQQAQKVADALNNAIISRG